MRAEPGVNRNKRAMSVDLRKPDGQAIVLKMLTDADNALYR